MIFALFRRSANARVIERLHGEIMAAVRQPSLYADYGVPDTFEGRFEMLAAFATLAVRRLMSLPSPGPEIAQDFTDKIFSELDAAMREMGVGDLAVPKRIKKFAAAFLGRRQAYDAALAIKDAAALAAALGRNVYGSDDTPQQAEALARYLAAADAAMAMTPLESFLKGPLQIPEINEEVRGDRA